MAWANEEIAGLLREYVEERSASRGWLTPDDVINTWPLDKLRAFLRKGR
jgi:DNA polymerase (family 10)